MTTISSHGPVGHTPGSGKPAVAAPGSEAAAPGKSAHSTAAQAREILALQAGEEGSERAPFGHTVSQVARGLLSLEDVVALQADAATEDSAAADDEAVPAADGADDSEAPAAAAEDPVVDAGAVPDTDGALADALAELLDDTLDGSGTA